MPLYAWKGLNAAGKPTNGTREADGPKALRQVLRKDGLFLTDLMGFGVNITTGDFSQGAGGHWIENGELTYPVTEINVSGNLREMLQDIEMVGNDLFFRGSSGAPTLLMAKLIDRKSVV